MESKNSTNKLGSRQPTFPPPSPPPRGKPPSLSKSPRMRKSVCKLLNAFITSPMNNSPKNNNFGMEKITITKHSQQPQHQQS